MTNCSVGEVSRADFSWKESLFGIVNHYRDMYVLPTSSNEAAQMVSRAHAQRGRVSAPILNRTWCIVRAGFRGDGMRTV